MKSAILLLVVFAVLALVVQVLKLKGFGSQEHKYKKLNDLFSPAEKLFFDALEQAVGSKLRVFGKVRVADVLEPRVSRRSKSWITAFNKIGAKHFDYVLCHPKTLKVIAVVELDDKSHAKAARVSRDKFLEAACLSAELKLIRFKAKAKYNPLDIQQQIKLELAPPPKAVADLKPLEPSSDAV